MGFESQMILSGLGAHCVASSQACPLHLSSTLVSRVPFLLCQYRMHVVFSIFVLCCAIACRCSAVPEIGSSEWVRPLHDLAMLNLEVGFRTAANVVSTRAAKK